MVEKGELVIKTPALSLDATLPFYSCDSASNFVARELTREGILAAKACLNIPIVPVEENGMLGHKVCLASEGKENYVVGLASPIDSFLGLFPCTRLDEAAWLMAYFTGETTNPFHRSPEAQIFEQPAWQLNGIDTMVKPLLAKNLADGRIAIAELGLGSVTGMFYLALVARIMRLDSKLKSAIIEWNSNLYLQMPAKDLVRIRDKVSKLESRPLAALELFNGLQRVHLDKRIPNTLLRDQGKALMNEAWPSVVEFLAKLPAEDLQTYILHNPSH